MRAICDSIEVSAWSSNSCLCVCQRCASTWGSRISGSDAQLRPGRTHGGSWGTASLSRIGATWSLIQVDLAAVAFQGFQLGFVVFQWSQAGLRALLGLHFDACGWCHGRIRAKAPRSGSRCYGARVSDGWLTSRSTASDFGHHCPGWRHDVH